MAASGEEAETHFQVEYNATEEMTNNTAMASSPMPAYAQAIIIIMYSTISVVAVGGNLIVVYIVVAYQRMRTVTNYFIVNLACSDILMAVLCIPFTFIANLLMHYWPFGAIMCPVVSYVQAVVVFLSAFTLVAISLDRYRAIMHPLKPRITTHQVALVIAIIWMFSLAVPLPIAIMSKIHKQPDRYNPTIMRDICQEEWPESQQRYIYSLLVMILQYFLPLFVLMFTYSSIAVVIWVKKMPGEAENNRDQRMAASKRKMVKMMITVVIIYALCWLPLHTITIAGDLHPTVWNFPYIQVVWIACHWLAMSNCCYNPIVYCWMNSKFRNGFKYILRWCPCVHYVEGKTDANKMTRLHTYVSTVKTTAHERIVHTSSPQSPYSSHLRQNLLAHTSVDAKRTSPALKCGNGFTNGKYSNRFSERTQDSTYLGESAPLNEVESD